MRKPKTMGVGYASLQTCAHHHGAVCIQDPSAPMGLRGVWVVAARCCARPPARCCADALERSFFCDLPDLTIAPDMLTLAEHILHSKASAFDPASFRDRYEEALLAHLKAKQAGAVPERKQTFAAPHRVVNLMEALRRSVAADTKGAAPRKGAGQCRGANGHEVHAALRRNTVAGSRP